MTHNPDVPLPTTFVHISAKTPRALSARAIHAQDHLKDATDVDDAIEVLHASPQYKHTMVAAGTTALQAATALAGTGDAMFATGQLLDGTTVFLFPGQGGQWVGMGRHVISHNSTFRSVIERCSDVIFDVAGWDLTAELATGTLATTRVIQPALFAMSAALTALWREMGVTPDAVVGHSQGEISAAYCAGLLDLDSAATLVAIRAAILQDHAPAGQLLAVNAELDDLEDALRSTDARVAVYNGKRSLVLAGSAEALARADQLLSFAQIDCRPVDVGYPAHTPALTDCAERLKTYLMDNPLTAGSTTPVTTYSTTFPGQEIDALSAQYWADNLVRPVNLTATVDHAISSQGARRFVEVSPHPVLIHHINELIDDADVDLRAFPTLRRDSANTDDFVRAALAVRATLPAPLGAPAAPGELLPYTFDEERLWVDNRYLDRGPRRVDLTAAFVNDHVIRGRPIVAGTHLLACALACAPHTTSTITHLTVSQPIPVDDPTTTVSIRRTATSFAVASPAGEHAAGNYGNAENAIVHRQPGPPADLGDSAAGLYTVLREHGYEYGPAFRAVTELHSGPQSVLTVEAAVAGDHSATVLPLHPALLDAPLQAFIYSRILACDPSEAFLVPYRFEGVEVSMPPRTVTRATFIVRPAGDGDASISIAGYLPTGEQFLSIDTVLFANLHVSEASAGPTLMTKTHRPIATPSRHDLLPVTGDVGMSVGAPPAMTYAHWLHTYGPRMYILGEAHGASRISVVDDIRRITQDLLAGSPQARTSFVINESVGSATGFLRSAMHEHPDRFQIIHARAGCHFDELCRASMAADEEVIVGDQLCVPSYKPLPSTSPRRPHERNAADLATGEVLVAVYFCGINFRDITVELGMIDGEHGSGIEVSGFVTAVGSAVATVKPGDKVMAIIEGGGLADSVTVDARRVYRVPRSWSLQTAAAVPVTYITALQCLRAAGVGQNSRVLVHAGAGGVGLAVIQLAHELGTEVSATASAHKRHVVHQAGIPWTRIANSRSDDFGSYFRAATGVEKPFDCVINSLTGSTIDESAGLIKPGGTFVEIGKTDIRSSIAQRFGINYLLYDLMSHSPDQIQQALCELTDYFDSGQGPQPRVTVHRGGDIPTVARRFKDGVSIGKHVVATRPAIGPGCKVMITGGTGGIGTLLARHLSEKWGVSHILAVSRSAKSSADPDNPVQTRPCDVTHLDDLSALVADYRPDVIIHAAGQLRDQTVHDLDPDALMAVMGPKASAALNIYNLCGSLGVSSLISFASISGVIGEPGQASYSAANTFLDSLAENHDRQRAGFSCQSIAWGVWQTPTGMTGHLSERDRSRLARNGLAELESEQALGLFDQVLDSPEQSVFAAVSLAPGALDALPSVLDVSEQRSQPAQSNAPATVRVTANSVSDISAEGDASVTVSPTGSNLLDTITLVAAQIIERAAPLAYDEDFRAAGYDSLTSLELRNILSKTLNVKLPPGIVFDHGTPRRLAAALPASDAG